MTTTTTQTPVEHRADQAKGFAVASLVTGIVALVVVITGWGGVALGLAALVLGIVALKKSQPKGMSVTGIVTGSLGLVGGILVLVIAALFMAALGTGVEILDSGDLSQLEDLGVEFETE